MSSGSVFEQLLGFVSEAASGIPDLRIGHTDYSMRDVGLAAFSVFYSQCPSFLAHQQAMQSGRGFNNARTLFGIESIPSDNWIRTLLDPVVPRTFYGAFDRCLDLMKEKGILEGMRTRQGHLLAGLDGTEFFRSEAIHCPHCTRTTHGKDRIEYSHMAVTPAIMKPASEVVFPLVCEFVRQQPGLEPQDCELVAGQRWIAAHGARYRALGLTLLGDDKYANHPTCTEILQAGFHFILNCKPSSHKELYTSLEVERKSGAVEELNRRVWTGKVHLLYHYRFCNALPIRDSEDALQVNWMELLITCEETGEQEYHNSFITDFLISRENVEDLVEEGRCRWKIENEHNNTLKTKGYHFEHNFGHGEDHLSEILLLLNLLAFLFHNILERLDQYYHRVRQKLSARETFFDGVRELTRYLCFASWDSLLRFMLRALEDGPGPPPDPNSIIR